MIQNLSITAIVENTAGRIDVLGEWGLSLWIEADHHRILYDTGQGKTLIDNARVLGIDLADATTLVISHGHGDHTGGIAALIGSGFHGKAFLHPAALEPRYQREEGAAPKAKGIPAQCKAALCDSGSEIVHTSAPTQIAPGIVVTGSIPRKTGFEDLGVSFFLDYACTKPDLLLDDQALLIETPRGWVVLTGCGHSGLINTLDYASALTGNGRICAAIGGLHLFRAPQERLSATVEQLRRHNMELLAPCHCSGFAAISSLQKDFGSVVTNLNAGIKLKFPN